MVEEIEYLTLKEIELVQKAYARGREDERKHLKDFFNIQGLKPCDTMTNGCKIVSGKDKAPETFEFYNFFCENCGCELSAFEIENFEGICLDCGGKR